MRKCRKQATGVSNCKVYCEEGSRVVYSLRLEEV
jgi:hypothetical protein